MQLLETPEFKENTIDTAWLDGIIKEKSVSVPLEPHTTVVAAVLYRAIRYVQSETAALLAPPTPACVSVRAVGPSLQ